MTRSCASKSRVWVAQGNSTSGLAVISESNESFESKSGDSLYKACVEGQDVTFRYVKGAMRGYCPSDESSDGKQSVEVGWRAWTTGMEVGRDVICGSLRDLAYYRMT
jgi:hypothetical protein